LEVVLLIGRASIAVDRHARKRITSIFHLRTKQKAHKLSECCMCDFLWTCQQLDTPQRRPNCSHTCLDGDCMEGGDAIIFAELLGDRSCQRPDAPATTAPRAQHQIHSLHILEHRKEVFWRGVDVEGRVEAVCVAV